jgi:hypothetical protein
MYYEMVKPLPIMSGNLPSKPAMVRPFHNINVWGGRFNDFKNLMLNRNFGHLITKLRVYTHQVGRLCPIMWARK